jgi:hypothetical protein
MLASSLEAAAIVAAALAVCRVCRRWWRRRRQPTWSPLRDGLRVLGEGRPAVMPKRELGRR